MATSKRFDGETIEYAGNTLVSVITDKETGVQYLLAIYPNMGSGLAVLVDEEGKPVLSK